MPRTAGLRGRLPVKPPGERFAIRYVHEYLATPLPAPVYPVDVTGGIASEAWGMLGNGPDPALTPPLKPVGDCGFAGRQHYRMAKASCDGEPLPAETSDELVTEYLQYDDGQDIGVNIADVLLAWYKAGKILAFAPVDHTDAAAVDSAMQQFKGLLCGVDLTDDADDLFNQGQPWTVAQGQQPDPDEGHCICKVKAAGGAGLDGWVTWGALQDSTPVWTSECLQEAWVLITSEDQIDPAALAALRADIDALGGTGGGTEPTPAPEPAPAPEFPITDADQLLADVARLAREIAADGDRSISELVAFLHSFGI